jgi:hypothetical protein
MSQRKLTDAVKLAFHLVAGIFKLLLTNLAFIISIVELLHVPG